jgi:3-deoxy-D-manno-octulosonic-acid transferase
LKRLKAKGLNNVSLASDTRFDRVWNTAMHAEDDSVIKGFAQNRKLLMFGSSWLPDIEALQVVLPAFDFRQWCIAIAPHHIDEISLKELQQQLSFKETQQLYTAYDKNSTTNILVINTMGRLSSLYKMADLVFVGGGFGKAVHNVLEPAVFAKPIVCGPRIQKFKEVLDLKNENGISVISYTRDFKVVWDTLSNDENLRNKMGESNFQYVKSRLGGADAIFNYLRTFF